MSSPGVFSQLLFHFPLKNFLMKKRFLVFGMVCLFGMPCSGLLAQQAFTASGGDAGGPGGSAGYSIGEAVYEHDAGPGGNINQGVQQPEINVRLAVKVLLSGPFDSTSGLMKDDLRAGGQLPATEPYSASPFNKPAIAESAGESTSPAVLGVSGPNAIVDWLYLELRAAGDPSVIAATKRALLQRDGDVVSPEDGTSALLFAHVANGDYYITVKHRNHLGVMTAGPVSLTSGEVSVDFTTLPVVYTKPGLLNTPRRSEGGVYTLWAGDASYNKNTKYNGLQNDKQAVLNALGGVANINGVAGPTYRVEDVNMDTRIRYNGLDNDRLVILYTLGVQTPNNILNQHTPD